jgi:hypothetical protein
VKTKSTLYVHHVSIQYLNLSNLSLSELRQLKEREGVRYYVIIKGKVVPVLN